MRLLVTRPEPDASQMRAELQALGHEVVVSPLFHAQVVGGPLLLAGVQAIVATSRNALRAVADQAPAAGGVLLVAVGPGTGALARQLGFTCVVEGPAAAADLPDTIAQACRPEAGPLLLLAGEVVAFDLAGTLIARGYEVRRQTVYRMVAAESLAPQAAASMAGGELDGVILMSPLAAQTYARLIERQGLADAAARLVHLCLSENVAAPLRAWRAGVRAEVAARPSRQEMLALVAGVAARLTKQDIKP